MKPLKVFAECFPDNLFYGNLGNGTHVLKGRGPWLLWNTRASYPAGFDIVTDVSQSSVTHPVVQTVADGKVDVVADSFVTTYERFSFVDFSYVTSFTTTSIISKMDYAVSGSVVADIFDNTSYILFGISLVLGIMVIYISLWLSNAHAGRSPIDVTILFVGNALCQPLPKSLHLEKAHTSTNVLIRFFDLLTFIIAAMYCSVLISKLTAKHETRPIDNMEELARRSERLLILKNSFLEDIIDDIPGLRRLKDRIDIVDETEESVIVPLVHEGSHVAIDTFDNFRIKFNYKTDMEDRCAMDLNNFKTSKDPIITQPVSWLLNKNSSYKEIVNKNLMWIHATGWLHRPYKRSEGGILTEVELGECPSLGAITSASSTSDCPKKQPRSSWIPISLSHLKNVTFIYATGNALGILAFIFEHLVCRLKRYKKRRQQQQQP